MRLSQAASLVQGRLQGQDLNFEQVCHDSRQIEPGALYVAIAGKNFDGHAFVQQAADKGAVAALVQHPVSANIAQIIVPDTVTALGELAKNYRRQFDLPVIAITGSCGKTTTKSMLASILGLAGNCLANPASFNNNIGCPLTVLQLNKTHDFAVFELGTNAPGEIAYLSAIAQPTVALITNIAAAHLGGFASLANIAQEKSAIYQSLPATGIAVVNLADQFQAEFLKLNRGHKIISYGLDAGDISADNIELEADGSYRFQLLTDESTARVKLTIMGRHNVLNALAAAACARALGIATQTIATALNTVSAPDKRLVVHQDAFGNEIIDDSYNANPSAVAAAINVLASRQHYKVLVLGEMLELGETGPQLHAEIGQKARAAGIDELYCFGELTQNSVDAFGDKAYYFSDKNELINALQMPRPKPASILIKGSRSIKMEQVVAALLATAKHSVT